MYPYILELGNFKIASYGVLSALAYLSAVFYLHTQRQYLKIEKDIFWNLITILVLGALIGSKIFYVILFWQDFGVGFFEKIINVFKNFRYGFVYFGGLIGAVASGVYYLRKKKIKIFFTADFFAPALALGHSIGRIGCFLAGCCYGKVSSSIFSVKFTHPECLVENAYLGKSLHPVQLYEVFGNIVLFAALHIMLKRKLQAKLKDGFVFLTYIAGYSVLRFLVEFLRADERGGFFAGLSPSQIIAAAAFLVSMAGFVYLRKKYEKK